MSFGAAKGSLRLCARRIAPFHRPCSSCFAHGARWSSSFERQWSTPLAKTLAEAIKSTGPISIAKYMRQCLTSDLGGYYSKDAADSSADQFGKKGDFVTSPEISQIFGELVGIWFVAEWMAQGSRKDGVQLIELGPGRGTLIGDVLRTIKNFKSMAESIETIYLVESSPALRDAQKKLLCGSAALEQHEIGHQAKCSSLPNAQVIWTEDVSFLPRDSSKSPFIVAHEFFDALPMHAFTSVSKPHPSSDKKSDDLITTSVTSTQGPAGNTNNSQEWRELLVSPTAPPSPFGSKQTSGPQKSSLDFELSVSSGSTPHSRLLPNLSPRYKSLLQQSGSTIEISPAARTTASTLAALIGSPAPKTSSTITGGNENTASASTKYTTGGAALLIDYGPTSTIPINSLRGIRAHKLVSPFEAPGLVDLSADVDFGALVEAALEGSEEVEVHGPVDQGAWLKGMGGEERKDALVRKARNGDRTEKGKDVAERIEQGWERLVSRGPNGMGKLYKAMAIVPANEGRRRPVGFGGDVDA